MTDYAQSGIRKARYGGYAHFPGTGPVGHTCHDCDYANPTKKELEKSRKKYTRCTKWQEIMSRLNPKIGQKPGPPINRRAATCKYWKECVPF